jgi:pyruvate formate lyase activating enzyme
MKEAELFQKNPNQKARCLACQHYCVISPGKTGICQTRLNQNGQLYSLTYGLASALQVDPIEKKPLYHFHPGSKVASFGSLGCNFRCKQCLNYPTTWGQDSLDQLNQLRQSCSPVSKISPAGLISQVQSARLPGIAFTYNEPSLNPEFVRDTAKLAKSEGLYTVFVTNGFWTKEALDYYGQYIDAVNIDFKGFSEKTYRKMGAFFKEIPEMAKYAQDKYKIHLEITTLLIPGINNSPTELKKMAGWIVKYLGSKTPWHLSRFSPELAPDETFAKIPPTPIPSLEKAAEIGRKVGLKFVYVWAPGADLPNGIYSQSDTICPKCGHIAVERKGWQASLIGVDEKGNCQNCGENLNLVL